MRSAWLAALALCTVHCGRNDQEARVGGELRLSKPREIRTLDPGARDAAEILTFNVLRQLYEGLVEYDPFTLAIVPRLATELSESEDHRTWRFALRDDVRFIDDPCFASETGRAVTAGDVKYSIERSVAAFRGSKPPHIPSLVGLEAFLAGGAKTIAGIQVLSDHEIQFVLERPDSRLPHFLAGPAGFIVAREAVQRYGTRLRDHPVGTGPFRLVSWDAVGIRLVRNRGYWRFDTDGEQLPYLDAVRWVNASDKMAVRLYSLDQLDAFDNYTFDEVPALLDEQRAGLPFDPPQAHSVTWLNTIYVSFNFQSEHPVVRDSRLRRALSWALPREMMQHLPARGLLPPGLPGYNEGLLGQSTNLDSARVLLARAGYPNGRGLPKLRLLWPGYADGYGRVIADSFATLGLDIDYQSVSDAEFARAVRRGQVDLFREGWIADYPDPVNFLQLFHSQSSYNRSGYSNVRYDALFERLLSEADSQRALELARQMERILVADDAALFTRHERQIQFVSSRVENWKTLAANPMNIRFYERLRLTDGSRP